MAQAHLTYCLGDPLRFVQIKGKRRQKWLYNRPRFRLPIKLYCVFHRGILTATHCQPARISN